MESHDEFSVYQFFPDGQYERVCAYVSAEKAVTVAKGLCTSVGARIGTTRRVLITDGGDCVSFEWKFGQGMTYPKIEI